MVAKIKDYKANIEKDSNCVLTPREVEYLSLIALGYHNTQIALIKK